MKVMIGAFAHESNDFCPHLTTREMFEFYEGEEVARHLPVADLFEVAGIEVIPSIYATAESYGPVEEETFLHFERMILDTVRANPDLDGIWMFCHGAMNVQNIGSGEYRLARDLRALVGENCVISFGMDLHGNLEEDFVNQVNIFRCYHTAPHTDQPDTYRRTARALVEYLRHGYRLHPQMRKLPMIFPGEMAATTVEPFKSIIAYLDELERKPEVLCASCYIGFAWTDAERTSSTVAVVPAAPEYEPLCAELADDLARRVFARRREFGFEMTALRPRETARASLCELPPPCCVTDMGDNPTAGTTGGGTVLLREYLAAVEAVGGGKRVLLAGICDPRAFAVCKAHQPGEEFDLSIGMDIDEVTRPVRARALYRGCHDVFRYKIATVPPIKRCEAVTVSVGTVDVVLTDQAYAFTQKVNFSSCELDPGRYDVFVTKFGYIFPELKELGKSFIMSNTPGESYQMITEFDYKKIRRPIYPLDDI